MILRMLLSYGFSLCEIHFVRIFIDEEGDTQGAWLICTWIEGIALCSQ